MKKIDKHFVSEIDIKMAEFDLIHPKTPAQEAEYNKYQKIYEKRDVPTTAKSFKDDIWD